MGYTKEVKKFALIFLSAVFLSINFGSLLYLKSTLLGDFFSGAQISLIFLLVALANGACFFLTPWLLKHFSKEKLFFLFSFFAFIGTLGLTHATNGFQIALFLIIYESFVLLAYWSLDIFVEARSLNKITGEIRGIYWTFINAGIALGAFLVSLLSVEDDLDLVFQVATFIMIIPLMVSFFLMFRKDAYLHRVDEALTLPFRAWWRARNLRAVTIAKFVLEIFFTLMVIYTPIYLRSLGFDWTELGLIFTIALLPFVFLEWPAGELADRKWGEKEMMSIGFFIIGTSLLIMPFLPTSFLGWMFVLLLSRIGASMVEIMTESYFFKKTSDEQAGFLSIFRLVRPAGNLVGATIGFLTLSLFSMEKIFFTIAIVILVGLYESLHLRDTR